MSHRIIEIVVGRLITDEQFRAEFVQDPEGVLLTLCECGLELSRTEMVALLNTDRELWASAADALDPRLQKVSLKNAATVSR